MTINAEGAESAHVLDAAKLKCPYCGGVEIMLTSLMDDPNDITGDTVFAALKISIATASFQGLVGLCAQCGHEWVPLWYCFDVGASDGTTITMTNLDSNRASNATANLLAGLYMVYLGTDANDQFQYFVINTNTAASPAVITPLVAPHGDSDGIYMITNILPFGLTAAS